VKLSIGIENSSQFSFLCVHRKVQEEYINNFLLATVLQLDDEAVEANVISGSWLSYFMLGSSIFSIHHWMLFICDTW
jgi:hypothetical protein